MCFLSWNSLHDMLGNFLKIFDCVQQAFYQLKMTDLLSPVNKNLIQDIFNVLEPVKICVLEIGKADADLMSADISLEFMLDKLSNSESPLASSLINALTYRITERRHRLMSSLLSFLINPDHRSTNKYDCIPMATQNEMSAFAEKLYDRLFASDHSDSEDDIEETESSTLEVSSKDLSSELRERIARIKKAGGPANIETTQGWAKKHFALFKKTRMLSTRLQLLKKALMSVKPTSIDCERVFSTTGKIVSPLRTNLSDKSINAITFLKYHFLSKK